MPSLIDVTKPPTGQASTADMRANFATAAGEISALQESIGAAADTGTLTIGTAPVSMAISVGEGAPTGATPGSDRIGSLYVDATAMPGSSLHISAGDGATWAVLG
jgi:hypothetical protein